MSNSDNVVEEQDVWSRGYWIQIIALVILCGFLWACVGMLAGGGLIYDVHEWGMFWIFGGLVLALPVAALVALILAAAVPGLAERRGSQRPLFWGRLAGLLWFLIAFVITLAAVLDSAL